MSEQFDVDVVIVGGGMVGAALGCSLGNSALRVAVIEEAPPQPYAPEQPQDLRVSAFSMASRNVLDMAGAWSRVLQMRYCPYRRMKVWETSGEVEFDSEEIDENFLGYIIENRLVQLALLERLPAFDNVKLFAPGKIKRMDYRPEGSEIELQDGTLLRARLLVAADGARSAVRQAAGLGVSGWDYEQHALVLSVETDYPQQDITWQRFTTHGPQAFLPMPGNHASLVWYEAPMTVKRLQGLDNDALLTELSAAFPPGLGKINRILAKGSFPLRRQHAQHYISEGVALVGDAAHTIHPLAGQGVNIGLLDAASLAEVLVQAKGYGKDIGCYKVLRQFERMRRSENLVMMTSMDLFYRVFGVTSKPVKFLRNLGLGLAETFGPAKSKVMRYAMGLEGNLPRLARGEALGK
ncbi:MAG: 2-octaprenyl-3-methyl-6-methoxy-1,4-benzoquinol hydroxylase [Methylococcaceae bacterium]|nr:MAG: 2-octaprenyl-3-methyl-6-methoxy-1,4-benzoquinol hydroxylase [Methylococcaceae bacterium]